MNMASRTFTRVALLTLARKSSRACGQLNWISSLSHPSSSSELLQVGVSWGKSRSPVWKYGFWRSVHGGRSRGPSASSKTEESVDIEESGGHDEEDELAEIQSTHPGGRGKKVTVKFAKKHTLVSADSVNLLEKIYRTYPVLIEYGESELLDFLSLMSKYGIDVERAVEVLQIYPAIFSVSESRLQGTMIALRDVGFNEKQRKSAIRRTPQLLEVPSKRITKQYTFLKTYLTTSETMELMGKSLEVFLESETTLKKKLEYLIKEMSHETKDISTCKALTYPLKHIKTRHEFLVRSGFFKPIPYRRLIKVLERDYKDKSKRRDKYYKPLEVICYKDADYLKLCTNDRLTLNELAAFEELYQAELEAEEEMEDEDVAEGADDTEDYEDDGSNDAVSLVKAANSVGFLSDAEAKGCYF